MQEVSGVYTSPFLDTVELKMALRAAKTFRGFRETGPWSCIKVLYCTVKILDALKSRTVLFSDFFCPKLCRPKFFW